MHHAGGYRRGLWLPLHHIIPPSEAHPVFVASSSVYISLEIWNKGIGMMAHPDVVRTPKNGLYLNAARFFTCVTGERYPILSDRQDTRHDLASTIRKTIGSRVPGMSCSDTTCRDNPLIFSIQHCRGRTDICVTCIGCGGGENSKVVQLSVSQLRLSTRDVIQAVYSPEPGWVIL